MRLKSCSLFILVLFLIVSTVFIPGKASASSVIDVAKQYLGVPYKFGGSSPSGFDCSGFVQYVYKQAGVSLPRSTGSQWSVGQSVSKGDLQPGDIIFFSGTYKSGISHSGIYVGNNQFIHASSNGVKTTSLNTAYWKPKYTGARRVVNGKVSVKPQQSPKKAETKQKAPVAKQKQQTTKQKQKQTVTVMKPSVKKPKKTIVITDAKHYGEKLHDEKLNEEKLEVMISYQDNMKEIVTFETELFDADKVIFVGETDNNQEVLEELMENLKKENIKFEQIDYEKAEKEKLMDKVSKDNYSFMFYGDKTMPEQFFGTTIEKKFGDLAVMLRKNGMTGRITNLMSKDKTMYYTVIRDVTLKEIY